jgi:hypothetical protein
MEEFVNRIIYKYDSKSKSLATDKNGVLIVDPRQLRDLAMFVVYQNNKAKEITKESFKEQTRQFDTNTKKLTRKLPEYEQMTLFEK